VSRPAALALFACLSIWSAPAPGALAADPPAPAAPPGLRVECELVPARVYVGQEARLTLRLLRAPGAPHGVLIPPRLGDAATLSPLGTAQLFTVLRTGVPYEAVERNFVLVPKRAGRLIVPAPAFEPASGEQGDARGLARTLEVRPVPPGAATPWLPARRLTLEEHWSRDPRALAAGRSVTLSVVIRADGLAAARLPRLELPGNALLRVRADRPDLTTVPGPDGLQGERVQRFVLIPTGDGTLTLPPVRVDWWDLGADAPRSAVLAARRLSLHPAPLAAALPERAPLMSERAELRTIVGVLLVLAAAIFVWQLRRQAVHDAQNRLREACRRGDPRAARAALEEWWTHAHPREPVALVSAMGAGWHGAAREQLAALDAALYAGRAWDGEAFWRGVRPCLRKRPSRRVGAQPPRPPLFRLQASPGPEA